MAKASLDASDDEVARMMRKIDRVKLSHSSSDRPDGHMEKKSPGNPNETVTYGNRLF
jgi:hypothetical protein